MEGENIAIHVVKEETVKIKDENITQFNGDFLGVWTDPEPSETKKDMVQLKRADLENIEQDEYDDYSDGEVKNEPSIDSSIDEESLQRGQYSQECTKRGKFK